jgi:hypothetical protein
MRVLWSVVLVTGCVTSEVVAPELDDGVASEWQDEPVPVQRLVPKACDTRIWPLQPDAVDVDLAVVATDTGASIFHVATRGGPVRGFQVDRRGELAGRMITIRDDQPFTRVSAGITHGRLVVAGTATDRVTVDLVRDDLLAVHRLGELEGGLVADLPVLPAREARIAVAAGDTGVFASGFEGGLWDATGTEQLAPAGIVSLAATGYRDDALIAWSTDAHECHLLRYSIARESVRPFPCEGVRIAMDPVRRTGTLVFELEGDVMRADVRIGKDSELANLHPVADLASSPRTAFDGERIWVSYLNFRGEIVVGFLTPRGELISRALTGVTPAHDGYELAVFNGGLWVVTAGESVFGALRMCAVPE